MRITQTDKIMRHMHDHGSITTMEAFNEYGITRLSARIWDLTAAGNRIKATPETGKNRYGEPVHYTRYSLEERV